LDWEKLQSLDVVRNNPKKKTLQLSERKAVVAYLRAHYYTDIVSFLSDRTLEWLIATTEVREFHTGVSSATTTNSMSNNIVHRSYKEGPMLRSSTTIYQEGIPSNICTLVLSGSLSIIVGKDDQFQTDMGPWSLLSLQALQDTDYTPDFTAFVPSSNTAMSSTRLLCIDRETFQAAKAAAAEEDDVQRKKEAKSSSSAKSDTTTTTSGYHDRTQLRSNLLAAFHQALIGNAAVTNGSNNGNNSNYT
jgi:CRP-like cAMP-binding protein